jgi:hypothetical protein
LSDLVLADITPRQLLRIAGSHLSTDYRKQLERFRMDPVHARFSERRYQTRRPRPECSLL